MPIDQSELPIILELHGGNFFAGALPLPFILGGPGGIVRPESLSLTRVSRGTVTHTAKSAFLDDFGEGVPLLTLQGHTGWSAPGLAGLPGLKALEQLFEEYLRRRQRTAEAMGDPDTVVLNYYDVLNAQAFTVYPLEFSVDRRKRSLLYFYRLRFVVLKDLLNAAVATGVDFITGLLGGSSGIGSSLGSLGDAFGGVGDILGGI